MSRLVAGRRATIATLTANPAPAIVNFSFQRRHRSQVLLRHLGRIEALAGVDHVDAQRVLVDS